MKEFEILTNVVPSTARILTERALRELGFAVSWEDDQSGRGRHGGVLTLLRVIGFSSHFFTVTIRVGPTSEGSSIWVRRRLNLSLERTSRILRKIRKTVILMLEDEGASASDHLH